MGRIIINNKEIVGITIVGLAEASPPNKEIVGITIVGLAEASPPN